LGREANRRYHQLNLFPWYRKFWLDYVVPHQELFGYLGPGMARGGAILARQQILIVALAIFVLSNPGRAMVLDGVFFSGGKGKAAR
jgi:hypothetical protein